MISILKEAAKVVEHRNAEINEQRPKKASA